MGTARWRIEQLNCKVIGPNRNDNLDRVEDMNLNPFVLRPHQSHLIPVWPHLTPVWPEVRFCPGRSENDEILWLHPQARSKPLFNWSKLLPQVVAVVSKKSVGWPKEEGPKLQQRAPYSIPKITTTILTKRMIDLKWSPLSRDCWW